MTTRIMKFTATVGATTLLAGLGTVGAASASAAAAPATATVATHTVPATVPIPTAPSDDVCKGILLLGLLCLPLGGSS
jgi:hypothetical protein